MPIGDEIYVFVAIVLFWKTYSDDIMFYSNGMNALPKRFCDEIFFFVAVWFCGTKFPRLERRLFAMTIIF